MNFSTCATTAAPLQRGFEKLRMAADIDIFPTEGNVRGPSARLGGAACRAVRAGVVRISASHRTRRELGRNDRRRRRDERDAGQQHSSARSADADAKRTGQRIERAGAIATQGNSRRKSRKRFRFLSPMPSARDPHETTQKKPPPKEVAKVEDNKIPFGEGGPVSGPYGSFYGGRRQGRA